MSATLPTKTTSLSVQEVATPTVIRAVENKPSLPEYVFPSISSAGSVENWLASNTTLRVQMVLKRSLDLMLALALLVFIAPVLLLIAALIRLDSPGPVIYKSLRIGRGYQPFSMYKFRTMRPDADSLRDQLRAQANLDGKLFKIKDDPRVTAIGRFLRATSLDELPQLFNVLQGNMSLVGPRPLPPDESAYFEAPYTVRFDVLPGVTGAWQVGGRSNASFQQLCNLEYEYVQSWSLMSDFQILFATIPAVLQSRGAF